MNQIENNNGYSKIIVIVIFLYCMLIPLQHLTARMNAPKEKAFAGSFGRDMVQFTIHTQAITTWEMTHPQLLPGEESQLQDLYMPNVYPYSFAGLLQYIGLTPELCTIVANFSGALFMFLSIYFLLLRLIPKHANLAMILFMFSAGLGGLLLISKAVITGNFSILAKNIKPFYGMTKIITYEMTEGTGFLPYSQLFRAYYTFSFGFIYLAINFGIQYLQNQNKKLLASILVFTILSTLINIRFGVLGVLLNVVALWAYSNFSLNRKTIKLFTLIFFAGFVPAILLFLRLYYLFPITVTANAVKNDYSIPIAIVTSLGVHNIFILYFGLLILFYNKWSGKLRYIQFFLQFIFVFNIIYIFLFSFTEFFTNQFLEMNFIKQKAVAFAEISIQGISFIICIIGVILLGRFYKSFQNLSFFPKLEPTYTLLFAWFLVAFTLCYLPIGDGVFQFNFLRRISPTRMLNFLLLPACCFTAISISHLINNKMKKWMFVLILIIMSLPSIFFLNQNILRLAEYTSKDNLKMYHKFQNLPQGRTLSLNTTGNSLPIFSHKRIMISDGIFFMDNLNEIIEDIKKYYMGKQFNKFKDFLKQNKIRYIYCGTDELMLNPNCVEEFAQQNYLKKILENDGLVIFEFEN